MNGYRGRALAAGLLALLVGTGIAIVAYNAGANHALMDGGRAFTTPPNAQVVYVRPYGFGFGFFPFLLFALFFIGLRGMFWRGRRYGYHQHQCGPHRDGTPGPDVTGTTV